MTEPPSRQFEAYEANGWPNEVAEYDPHGVAAGGMYSQCDGCSSREWYGPNPWSAPGTARHFDFVMGGSGGNMLGTCGLFLLLPLFVRLPVAVLMIRMPMAI